jgi:hypothetical protein
MLLRGDEGENNNSPLTQYGLGKGERGKDRLLREVGKRGRGKGERIDF